MAVQTEGLLHASSATAPVVSVVVIGRNEGARLTQCLLAVLQVDWRGIAHECIYIDSSSTDQSMEEAKRLDAAAYMLDDAHPSAAKARNLGLQLARGEFIMFLDGDSMISPDFVAFALSKMTDSRRCAITGHLREAHPDHSFFNKMIDLDWITSVGEILFFGGNAFVRRSCLLAVDGFNPALQGGEEPELCARLRANGWLIELFDLPMARHDLGMTSFKEYWNRAFRSGIGLAEVAHQMHQIGNPLWQYEVRRDWWQGLLFLVLPLMLLLACLITPWLFGLFVASGLLALARTASRCAWKAPDNRWLRWQYAMHTFFCKVPAVLGQLVWYGTHIQRRILGLVSHKHAHRTAPHALPRFAYLISLYPATSHTFILQEIEELRRLGHEILTASINSAAHLGRSQDLTQNTAQLREANHTFYVKAEGYSGALHALFYWSFQPIVLFKMFCFGFSLESRRCSLLGLAYALEAAIIAKWMRQNNLVFLHVHFGNAAATVGLLVKRLTGCHLSLSIHGSDEFDDVTGQHLALKVKEADRLICMSQYFKAVLMRLSAPEYWAKLIVCRLGVETNRFAFAARQPHVAPQRLLCVGRLIPSKCQLLLIQACAKLRDLGHDFKLVLVGAGPDQLRLEQAIAAAEIGDKVVMTGALAHQAVLDQFAKADIFVLPSLNEGIPVVLMEAMSCGVPCVSTPVSGIPELIEHNRTGLLATQGDLDSLVHQLERLMTQPALREQIASRARQKVVCDFNLMTNVLKLSGIYQSFLASTPSDGW
jgi:glycosyltransferase involved in cell wall biosynthesis/GT2 family glycosyltransferase